MNAGLDRSNGSEDPSNHRHHLIAILRNAYSGEQAAAYAYRGHWKSVSDDEQKREIRRIEEEEWGHRREVGEMLAELGAEPSRAKEIRTWIVGRVLGIGCRCIGWFLPMYFAGRLESGNWKEYETAAEHAAALGFDRYVQALTVMSDVEKEHELFFRRMIVGHRWLPLMERVFGWK